MVDLPILCARAAAGPRFLRRASSQTAAALERHPDFSSGFHPFSGRNRRIFSLEPDFAGTRLSRPTSVRSRVALAGTGTAQNHQGFAGIRQNRCRENLALTVTDAKIRSEIIASGCVAALFVCSMVIFQILPFTQEEKERRKDESTRMTRIWILLRRGWLSGACSGARASGQALRGIPRL